MYELRRTIPDVKMLLAPEDLGSMILFLLRLITQSSLVQIHPPQPTQSCTAPWA